MWNTQDDPVSAKYFRRYSHLYGEPVYYRAALPATPKIRGRNCRGPYPHPLKKPGGLPIFRSPKKRAMDAVETPVGKPFCHDKKILPVWDELKRDKDFQESIEVSDGTTDCAGMFEYKAVDLNRDGQMEIMLRGKTVSFCGGVGNCMMWIFERKGGRYRTLLATTDYVDASEMGSQIRKTRTNGYADLLLKGHIDAGNTHHVYFNFDGKKYRQGKCLVDAYVPGSSPDPKWKLITCAEFEKYYYNR